MEKLFLCAEFFFIYLLFFVTCEFYKVWLRPKAPQSATSDESCVYFLEHGRKQWKKIKTLWASIN